MCYKAKVKKTHVTFASKVVQKISTMRPKFTPPPPPIFLFMTLFLNKRNKKIKNYPDVLTLEITGRVTPSKLFFFLILA